MARRRLRGNRTRGRQHPCARSLTTVQIAVRSEVFVGAHYHAARNAKVACERAGRRKQGPCRQPPLLDRRPQVLLQLLAQAASFGPVQRQQDVERKAGVRVGIGKIGLLRNIGIGS